MLNEIKRQSALATSTNTTFLWSMSSSAIDDMAEVAVTAIESVAAKALKNFTADIVGPTVTGVELDMRLLELTLNFSETVNTSPLDVTEIVVQNSTGRIASESVQTSTRATASADGLQVVIGLSVADASSIKAAGALATVSTADAFVTLSNTTISDMNGAAVVSLDDTATRHVDVLVADNIAPSLSQFDLDMNGVQLVLRFSETARARTLSVTQLSLQSNTTLGSGGSFTLTSSSTVSTADSTTVAVSLSASDANAINYFIFAYHNHRQPLQYHLHYCHIDLKLNHIHCQHHLGDVDGGPRSGSGELDCFASEYIHFPDSAQRSCDETAYSLLNRELESFVDGWILACVK